MGHLCSSQLYRIVEKQYVFLAKAPTFGVAEGKRMCVMIMVMELNIYRLPVLSFRIVTQLTIFLAGRNSVLTHGTSCVRYFHTPFRIWKDTTGNFEAPA